METILMQQLDLEQIKDPKMAETLFKEKLFPLTYANKSLKIITVGNRVYVQLDDSSYYCFELEVWTNNPKLRLKVVTGERKTPNGRINELLTVQLNKEYEFRKIKTILTNGEIQFTNLDYDRVAFLYPFPVIPEIFKEIYPLLDPECQDLIDHLNNNFCDSIAAYFRKLYEEKYEEVIPFYRKIHENKNYFMIEFSSPATFEKVRNFKQLLIDKKEEVEKRYQKFCDTSDTKKFLKHLIKENILGIYKETEKFLLDKLNELKTPFD